ncbi:MAG: YgiT-type zinc finger protein [Anaerolineales bacterium]
MFPQFSQVSTRKKGLCIECQTGVHQLQYITFFAWLDDDLITVPNFPAYVCDVCGRLEYDRKAILWLNSILNPTSVQNSIPLGNSQTQTNQVQT